MSLAEEVAALLPDGLIQGYGGVVKTVTKKTTTVDIRGALIDCGCNAGYAPVVGDNVLVMRVGNTNSWVIAFKVKPASLAFDWTPATLTAGWTYFGAPYEVPGYRRKADGTVELRGLANGPTGTKIFNLPPGCHPGNRLIFDALNGGASARIDVDANGDVLSQGSSTSWWTLDGISFAAVQ